MNFSTSATMVFAMWIRHNKLEKAFGLAPDLKGFKTLVKMRLFGDEKPPAGFVKGAKMAEWDKLYSVCKGSIL